MVMNIEILEFYPIECNEDKEILTGTLRIKLCDFGIHILGIWVKRRKNSWYFTMPGRNGTHHETGETIRYPFIVFEDREMQRILMEAIREQGRAFIEKKLADIEKPLIFPQQKQKDYSEAELQKSCNNSIGPKIEAKSLPAILTRDYRDLPPRSTTAFSRGTKSKR